MGFTEKKPLRQLLLELFSVSKYYCEKTFIKLQIDYVYSIHLSLFVLHKFNAKIVRLILNVLQSSSV